MVVVPEYAGFRFAAVSLPIACAQAHSLWLQHVAATGRLPPRPLLGDAVLVALLPPAAAEAKEEEMSHREGVRKNKRLNC